jgi:phosphonate transport system permease protein
VVGAGGIGVQRATRIRINHWNEVSFILLMILATVSVIDLGCRTIRRRVTGSERP